MFLKKLNVLYEVGLNVYKVDLVLLIYENCVYLMYKFFLEFLKFFVYYYVYYNKLKINYVIW